MMIFLCCYQNAISQCCCDNNVTDIEVPGGDFEFSPTPSPGGWIDYTSGQSVGPWEVDFGSISHHDDGHNNLGNGNPNPSNAHLDLNGFSEGGVCQDISGFVIGQQYELVFFYAIHNGVSSAAAIVEIDGGNALDEDWSANNQGQNLWLEATYTFTATDETMELCFSSDGGVPCCGMLIDDIEIFSLCIPDSEFPELIDLPDNEDYICLDDVPFPADVTGSDNCITNIDVDFDEDIDDNDPCEIIIERTWTAEDECGNEEEHTQFITVIDDEGPVFDEPPSDLEVLCDQNYQRIFDEWIDDFGEAEFEEHCGEEDDIELVVIHEILDSAICSQIEVTFIFTDNCDNETIEYADFSIDDDTPPKFITPPSNLNISCGDDPQTLIDEWLGQDGFSEASDNCSHVMSNDFSGDYNSSQLVSFIATDRCGMTAMLQAEILIDMNLQVVEIDTFTCDPSKAGIEEIIIDNVLCDSLLRYSFRLLPSDTVLMEVKSCDLSAIGYDTFFYSNFNGCDSMVVEHTVFSQSDTLYNTLSTCDFSQAGMDTLFLSNVNNCDSLVIINSIYSQPDTTYQTTSVCKADEVGLDTLYLSNSLSCDSIIIIDKTYLSPPPVIEDLSTCDPGKVGIDSIYLVDLNNCDSLVIRRTMFSNIDTSFSDLPTCEVSNLVSDTLSFTSIENCDSIVVNNYFLVQNDTIVSTEYSCDIDQPIYNDTTIPGPVCDTILITEMLPLLSDTILVESTTCKLSEVGIFTTSLVNMNGCDSTIINSIRYAAIDTLFFVEETCFISELVQDTIAFSSADCDSVYVFSTILLQGNQVEFNEVSCREDEVGVDTMILQNMTGCDSLVITETSFIPIQFDWSTAFDPCAENPLGVLDVENLSSNGLSYSLDDINFSDQTTYPDLTPGNYTLYVQDENGCRASPVDFFFEASSEINLDLPVELTLVKGSSQQILLEFSEQPETFYWSDESLVSCTDCLDPLITSLEDVELIIFFENEDGCLFSRSIIIKVDAAMQVNEQIYVPNVFSPERNGDNNFFQIFASDPTLQLVSCNIYDRWGNKVYASDSPNIAELKWDGTFLEEKAEPGVYIYSISLINGSGESNLLVGNVTLFR